MITNQPKLHLKGISQVALVVKDLKKSMDAYWKILGIGPWKVYEYGPELVKDQRYRGRPMAYHTWVALANFGDQVIELMEQIDGDTLYKEFEEKCGEGVQHLGVFVDNFPEAVKEAEAAGFKVIMTGHGYGKNGDGAYAYLDTAGALGVIWELIEIPTERATPAYIYPPEAE